MRIKATILVIIITVLTLAADAKAEWLERMFVDDWKPAAKFVNTSCQPSDVGGIQTVWTQKGNKAGYVLYVFCRHDMAPNVLYNVQMVDVSSDTIASTATTLLGNPAVKLGGYYFGNVVGKDGLLYIQKIK